MAWCGPLEECATIVTNYLFFFDLDFGLLGTIRGIFQKNYPSTNADI
jgi:hypothetical protein